MAQRKKMNKEGTLRMYTQNLCVDVPISIELRFGIWEYNAVHFADGIDGPWPYVLKVRYTTQKKFMK